MVSVVLAYLQGLFFEGRLRDVVQAQGGTLHVTPDPAAVSDSPAVVLVEMGPVNDPAWQAFIQEARRRWPQVPVVAFGPHVDTEARQRALQLGCEHVLSRRRFHEEAPALLQSYLVRREGVTGCEEPLPALAREGIALFNRGAYFEAHEVLEEAWRAESRPCRALYQGILQLGVALYHIEQGNVPGARKVLQRAERKLASLPDWCQGVDVEALRRHVRTLRSALRSIGPDNVQEFPRTLFPSIPVDDHVPTSAS